MTHPNVLIKRTSYGKTYWQWGNTPADLFDNDHVVEGAYSEIAHVYVGLPALESRPPGSVIISASAQHDAPSCCISAQDALTLAAALVRMAGLAAQTPDSQ